MGIGNVRHLFRGLLVVFLFAGCVSCSTTNKVPEYMGSHLLPPLEVPPGLDKPVVNERMRIPQSFVANGGEVDGLSGTNEAGTRSIEKPPEFIETDDDAK
jgi:uncharacterized lipoprotein